MMDQIENIYRFSRFHFRSANPKMAHDLCSLFPTLTPGMPEDPTTPGLNQMNEQIPLEIHFRGRPHKKMADTSKDIKTIQKSQSEGSTKKGGESNVCISLRLLVSYSNSTVLYALHML